jgi:hypothetical protein
VTVREECSIWKYLVDLRLVSTRHLWDNLEHSAHLSQSVGTRDIEQGQVPNIPLLHDKCCHKSVLLGLKTNSQGITRGPTAISIWHVLFPHRINDLVLLLEWDPAPIAQVPVVLESHRTTLYFPQRLEAQRGHVIVADNVERILLIIQFAAFNYLKILEEVK